LTYLDHLYIGIQDV